MILIQKLTHVVVGLAVKTNLTQQAQGQFQFVEARTRRTKAVDAGTIRRSPHETIPSNYATMKYLKEKFSDKIHLNATSNARSGIRAFFTLEDTMSRRLPLVQLPKSSYNRRGVFPSRSAVAEASMLQRDSHWVLNIVNAVKFRMLSRKSSKILKFYSNERYWSIVNLIKTFSGRQLIIHCIIERHTFLVQWNLHSLLYVNYIHRFYIYKYIYCKIIKQI